MAQAQSISYGEEKISLVVLSGLTLFLGVVLSLLLRDFYSKQRELPFLTIQSNVMSRFLSVLMAAL